METIQKRQLQCIKFFYYGKISKNIHCNLLVRLHKHIVKQRMEFWPVSYAGRRQRMLKKVNYLVRKSFHMLRRKVKKTLCLQSFAYSDFTVIIDVVHYSLFKINNR